MQSLLQRVTKLYGTRPDFDVETVPTKPKVVKADAAKVVADGAVKLGQDISNFFATAVGGNVVATSPTRSAAPAAAAARATTTSPSSAQRRSKKAFDPAEVGVIILTLFVEPQLGQHVWGLKSVLLSTCRACGTQVRRKIAQQKAIEVAQEVKPQGAKPTHATAGVVRPEQAAVERTPTPQASASSEKTKSAGFEANVAANLFGSPSRPQQLSSDPALPASVQTASTDPFAELVDLASPTSSSLRATNMSSASAAGGSSSTSDVAADLDEFFAVADSSSATSTNAEPTSAATAQQSHSSLAVPAVAAHSADSLTAQSLTDFFSSPSGGDAGAANSSVETPGLSPTPDLRTALIDYYYVYNKEKLVCLFVFRCSLFFVVALPALAPAQSMN